MKLWIRLDADSPRTPRAGKLSDLLGVPQRLGYGMLVAVWCAMAEHAPDGDLSNVSDSTINEWAGWHRGERSRSVQPDFASVFRSLFLDESAHDPDYAEQQGKLVERARLDRERMARRGGDGEQSAKSSRNLREIATEVSPLRNGTERNEAQPHRRGGRHAGEDHQSRGLGMALIGELRDKRSRIDSPQGGVHYFIDKRYADALEPAARQALENVGGTATVANATESEMRIIRGQYARIYEALLNPAEGSHDGR